MLSSMQTLQAHQSTYPQMCALSVMSLDAWLFQIFRLMRPYLLEILDMVLMLESGHAVDVANSMLDLRQLAL
jgi:hypothetical protein